ncbi:FixH family protein [Mesobacillus foraminis]|uniref:FixH family protein n=1 Tax=Mesobacillus foraminis TaxID=279826 RepID=UPI001BEAEB76|nr:FixH family protein [Mesobacillus foraminis]MBT2759032.1 FixH family protein [Mesobacillus foraminis]
MKKLIYLPFILLLLSACVQLKDTAATLYEKEKPIEIRIELPDSISKRKPIKITAVLTQDQTTIENAEFVHFQIWKSDGSVNYGMEEAVNEGMGRYSISKQFDTDGLYYIKVHAGSNDSIIMPQYRIVVGYLTEQDLKILQEGQNRQNSMHEHHH